MLKQFSVILFLTILLRTSFAQNTYPTDYFRSPVDTIIALAGNFGEIRPNHFHAGFDIKTNGREGMRVYAAADGYISRIKISPFGYGKSLYITHPNGYTSVYGHLKSFEGLISELTKNSQYKLESFEIDTLLAPDALPVKKGQLIALSGNTGGSQGPHLHFEIRETATEKPINPYCFGYKIEDNVKPKITEVVIYPLSDGAYVNSQRVRKKFSVLSSKGNYSINKLDTIVVHGSIGFGIETYDTESKSSNQNGVYSIELQSGGKRIYYHELEKFSFENARYVNAHIDYKEKQEHNEKIQKCFLSKNNQLGIYKNVINNGVINFNDDSVHWIRYIVKDYNGNTSELMLKIKSSSNTKAAGIVKEINGTHHTPVKFDCTQENKFTQDDVQVTIPPNALYDDLDFQYSKPSSVKGTYSLLHQIQDDETALQKSYTLSIKPTHFPDALQNKACLVSITDKGRRTYEGGKYADGWVTTQTKDFGNFAVVADTIAPKLKTAFKYSPNSTVDLSNAKTIGIIATDNLSGIRKYKAIIDGKWVLCEYEFKQNLLFYTFDDSITKGKHTFTIQVTDDKENTSTLTFIFKR